jgi:inward rectifier potassium channel
MDRKKREKNKPTRLLNREGELNVHKDTLNSFVVYNHLLKVTWQRLLLYAFTAFIIINLFFSICYFSVGGINCLKNVVDRPSFWQELMDVFFFSTQTFTTVGYGHVFPSCLGANFIAAMESFTGWIFFSVVTGLFYAKFTQPQVEVRLSDVAVIENFKDGYGFKFMLANEYENKLVDLEVTLDLIKLEMVDGRYKKRFYQLFLFRKRIPYLSVPWTVVHPIDEKSPLYGLTKEEFDRDRLEFFVQVKAFDEAHRQIIFKEFSYFGNEEVMWGHKFVNIQRYTETGALKLNMKRFGKVLPVDHFADKIPPNTFPHDFEREGL